jgi:cell division protease FtsH
MVGSLGMAGSLVSYQAIEAGPIRQGIVGKVLGNEESRNAVETMLEQAKDEVRKLLDENRHLVVALRDALLERDELVGDEIMDVLRESAQRDALERSS